MRECVREDERKGAEGREGQYVFLYHAMDYIRLEWVAGEVRPLKHCIKRPYKLY